MVFFNYALRKLNAKIVYYGPGLCGKTTNLQWIHDHLEGGQTGKMVSLATEGDRTIFFDLLPLDIGTVRGMQVTLQLYTVPGQVHYNATRQLVLRGADGVVFVGDSQAAMRESNIESWKNLKDNLRLQGIRIEQFPHVLQFNKRDLREVLPVEELDADLNEFDAPLFEAVAVKGIGVQETLEGIVRLVMRSLRDRYEMGDQPREPVLAQAPAAPPQPPAPARSAPSSVSVGPWSPAAQPPAMQPLEPAFVEPEPAGAITRPSLETDPGLTRDLTAHGQGAPAPEELAADAPDELHHDPHQDLYGSTTIELLEVEAEGAEPADDPASDADLTAEADASVAQAPEPEPSSFEPFAWSAAADEPGPAAGAAGPFEEDEQPDAFVPETPAGTPDEPPAASFTETPVATPDEPPAASFTETPVGTPDEPSRASFAVTPAGEPDEPPAAAPPPRRIPRVDSVEERFAAVLGQLGRARRVSPAAPPAPAASAPESVPGPPPPPPAAPSGPPWDAAAEGQTDEAATTWAPAPNEADADPFGGAAPPEPSKAPPARSADLSAPFAGDPAVAWAAPDATEAPETALIEEPEQPAAAAPAAPADVNDVFQTDDPFAAPLVARAELLPPRAAMDVRPDANQLRVHLEGTGALAQSGQVRELDIVVPVPGGLIGNQRVTLQLRLTLTPVGEETE